jgi:sortase (surface protein transpeptidase)
MFHQKIQKSILAFLAFSAISVPAISAPSTPAASQPTVATDTPVATSLDEAKISQQEFTPTKPSTLTIPTIGLETKLSYETLFQVASMEEKLLHGPVVENQEAAPLCSPNQNAYIYGHSEPAVRGTENYSGVRVFEKLEDLKPGDLIEVVDQNGQECAYQVQFWEEIQTNADGSVSRSVFEGLMKPNTQGEGWLTLQTCDKNEATGRLILRAKLVNSI